MPPSLALNEIPNIPISSDYIHFCASDMHILPNTATRQTTSAVAHFVYPFQNQKYSSSHASTAKQKSPSTHALLYIIYRTECLISLQTIAGKNQDHYQELPLLSITVTEQIFISFQSICSEVWFPSTLVTQYSILRERA